MASNLFEQEQQPATINWWHPVATQKYEKLYSTLFEYDSHLLAEETNSGSWVPSNTELLWQAHTRQANMGKDGIDHERFS